ncbi:carbohydrate ABC transporter permease [Plantactinospora sp. GCM10030261]|uniref:carbohydrate ABC transporter permease n=1 Tax=Plantactinospora sp. GCM10030261 TaxID=3273420 RepID=UPI0036209DB1
MGAAVLLFVAVVGAILFVASLIGGRRSNWFVAYAYLLPVLLMLTIGLLYPALLTIDQSFLQEANDSKVPILNLQIPFANLPDYTLNHYQTIFTTSGQLTVLRNTVLWVVLTPFVATAVGLVYAILVDKARLESLAKALIFLPMSISFVGAGIIWKFVYEFRPDQGEIKQIGLLNQIIVWLGGSPQQWLVESPWNTLFLIMVMIWIQAGFAMTVLSAAIKAIPDDIIEAARLDGVTALGMFRFITLPSIRPTVVVVLTTIGIGTLKVFDIVRTMTGGNFNTSVIANEFYDQSFRSNNPGLGAALAVLLFILVIPIVVYNIRQLRAAEAR